MTKIGDKVRFLNTTGGGIVRRIQGQLAYVDEGDGFEVPVLLKEIVTVDTDRFYGPGSLPHQAPSKELTKPAAQEPVVEELPIEETPDGDRLNIVLAYEPRNLKQLGKTPYDTVLVNDSNYFLHFTYLTRGDEQREWTARYCGTVEPNIEIALGELQPSDLAEIDRIAVQIIAFKQGKPFELKAPVDIQRSIDTTKFFKLHCFRENPYFDTPVIAIDLVKNDVAQRPLNIDSQELQRELNTKKRNDQRPSAPHKQSERRRMGEPIEVDLHASELLDTTAGLSNSDILEVQLREARRVLDANRRNRGQRIVLIHGKGEGVLRKAVLELLNKEFKGYDVQDASFREYGFGATQVTVR